MQENLLEDISQGVGVLKQQALDIDKEVTSQNVALDKLEQVNYHIKGYLEQPSLLGT